jgi:hypothetical protein
MLIKFENFINESKLEDYNFDNVFTQKYINDIVKISDWYDNLYDTYIDNEENTEDEVNDIILEILYDQFMDAIYAIDYYINNGKLKIYRMMTVDDDYYNKLKTTAKHLGIYWSYEENAAEAHWGDFSQKHTVKITSEIPETSINWLETLRLNTMTGVDEKEIRLYKNTRIKILNLEIDNEPIDITEIKDKIFLA